MPKFVKLLGPRPTESAIPRYQHPSTPLRNMGQTSSG